MRTTAWVCQGGIGALFLVVGLLGLPSAHGVTIEIDTPSELDMIGKSAPYPPSFRILAAALSFFGSSSSDLRYIRIACSRCPSSM